MITRQADAAPKSWWARMFGSSNSTALKAASSKKRLVRSRLDSMLLLLPFMLWAILIIVIYPISYAYLADLATPVSMVNMANYLSEYCDFTNSLSNFLVCFLAYLKPDSMKSQILLRILHGMGPSFMGVKDGNMCLSPIQALE